MLLTVTPQPPVSRNALPRSTRDNPFTCTLLGAFEDDDVTHVEGDVNPVRDLDIISEELRLKDVEFLNVHLEKLEKLVIRGNDKKLKPEYVSTT